MDGHQFRGARIHRDMMLVSSVCRRALGCEWERDKPRVAARTPGGGCMGNLKPRAADSLLAMGARSREAFIYIFTRNYHITYRYKHRVLVGRTYHSLPRAPRLQHGPVPDELRLHERGELHELHLLAVGLG